MGTGPPVQERGATWVGTAATRRRAPSTQWDVPERYNIAADVCDKHPPDKLAMIHEHFDGDGARGAVGRAAGRVEPLRARAARARRGEGRPRRDAAAADARDRGGVLRHVQVRRDPALDVGALRRRRHPPPRVGLRREGAGDRRGERRPDRPVAGRARAADRGSARRAATTRSTPEDTLADDPAQLYYSSGTTGLAKGILHAHRYLLAHEEFVYCHDVQDGELFHGMGEWAWAAGHRAAARAVAARRGAARLPARGRLRPAPAARRALAPRRDERLHDADGDALDDGRSPTPARATRSSSASCAARASRSTPRRSAGSASSTA